MKPATTLPILLLLTLLLFVPAHAQVPSILNYQGRVTVGGTNLTTNAAQFKFALVNGDGTEVYWRNDGSTIAGEPSSAVSVAVAQGLYSTLLGDATLPNMAALPSAVFTNPDVNLRVWFSAGDTNAFVQLAPDQRIGASGYALRAAVADSATVTNVAGDLNVSGILYTKQIVGGSGSLASGAESVVVGGTSNQATNFGSVSVGGQNNRSFGENSFVGGGSGNLSAATFATVGGGQVNTIVDTAVASTIGGGQENSISSGYATIGGGYQNQATAESVTISGGDQNVASRYAATVGGGINNRASGESSVVAGGAGNEVTNSWATVAGGRANSSGGLAAFVGGGEENSAAGPNSVVGGGYQNASPGEVSSVLGGYANEAPGFGAAVAGGISNSAVDVALAAGLRARATNYGSFVWSSGEVPTVSTNDYSFTVRAPGGARFLTTTASDDFVGVVLTNGATQWASLSDRNSKTDFEPVQPREILSKVSAMPITSWRYKHDPQRRYIGPMAQDFHAAFGLGSDDKTIGTLDSDGVMYAAIQGLVEELKERDEVIEELKSKLESFEQRLNALPPAP